MSSTDKLIDACRLVPKRKKGECSWCHGPLKGKQRQWCSKGCQLHWVSNHSWSSAKNLALKLAGHHCTICGSPDSWEWTGSWGRSTLEVNHIIPVVGDRSSYSCNHHQSNLQVVCRPCHKIITKGQHAAGVFKKPLTAK